ncbi:TVP38/TMEM64 family protein [Chloroflexota bacterium]
MGNQTQAPEHHQADSKPTGVRGRFIAIALYVALSVGLYFILAPLMTDQDRLQSQIETSGLWGILLYIGLYSAQVFIPWLPGAPLDIIGGAVFGFWETTIISSVTAAVSGIIIYLIVRRVGLDKIVTRFPNLLESPWRLVRIIKLQPWALVAVNMLTGDVAHFIAGAAATPLLFTVVLLGIMRIPNVMVGAAIGAGLLSNVFQDQMDIVLAVASIGTIVALSIGFLVARKYIPVWLSRVETTNEAEQQVD